VPSTPHDNTRALPADSPGPRDGDRLAALGWDDRWQAACPGIPHLPDLAPRPGRVTRVDRGRAHVITQRDDVHVSLHGPHIVPGSGLVTGDWVLVDGAGNLHAVLPRRTVLTRGGGRRDTRAQVLAANVDVVVVVVPLTAPPNLPRLDRMLALAWESGAQPVVVLSKADLCHTAEEERAEVAEATVGVPVLLVSTVDGRGLDDLRAHLAPGRTLVLLGASGVGKSSLVNALAGTDLLAVGPIRDDGKGRHTTTSRDLVVLPGVGVLIDTPGLRGVQLWDGDEGLGQAFADIEKLARGCRFGDCAHRGEPGCAVAAAVEDGRLSRRRLDSYAKLHREVAWLQDRYDARQRAEARRQWRIRARAMRERGHR
jgi:ribosome biogenesis GTPase / thiamine phosphate phosphatase